MDIVTWLDDRLWRDITYGHSPNIESDLKQLQELTYNFDKSKLIEKTIKQQLSTLCQFSPDLKWTLIYRASEHGFTAADFHSKCDNVANTLIVIKSTSGCIFGGFTSQVWDQSNRYKQDPDAFLFSLVNPEDKPEKLKILKSTSAIYCKSENGPIFGQGPDLFIRGDSTFCLLANFSNLGSSYPMRSSNRPFFSESKFFHISDMDVYQIV